MDKQDDSTESVQGTSVEAHGYVYAWEKYGLSLAYYLYEEHRQRAIRNHNLVARYLEEHPKVAADYKPDQSGVVKYFEVLEMAERVYT